MKDLVVIVPLHIFNEDVAALLKKAIGSVPEGVSVRISVPKGISKDVKAFAKDMQNVKVVVSNDENTDFCSLVNNGVGEEKYFSILEFDDTYTPIWLRNFMEYADAYPDVSVFMYLEDLMDYDDDKYIGFGNEAPLASSFSNTLGEIDNDCLQEFFDFYMTGSVFKTEDWREIGGLKTNIPISFWYEFLLRATNKQKRVMVIPKVGYVHYLGRKGSLVDEYVGKMNEKEGKYWFNVAKKESFYKIQRDVDSYTEDSENEEEAK